TRVCNTRRRSAEPSLWSGARGPDHSRLSGRNRSVKKQPMSVTSHSEPVAASSILFNPVWRKIAVQVGLAAVVAFLIYAAANNAIERMHEQGTASGFQFLWRPAGFDISQRPIEFAAKSSSNARAFAVGLLNTLIVASLGIVLATIIGFVVGISR